MNDRPEFMKDATNVYRTRDYIVKQVIGLKCDESGNSAIISHDTFYRRTRQRDREYETALCMRTYIDGKRIRSFMSDRRYVD